MLSRDSCLQLDTRNSLGTSGHVFEGPLAPRFARKFSTWNPLYRTRGTYPQNCMMENLRNQISELHFDKFPDTSQDVLIRSSGRATSEPGMKGLRQGCWSKVKKGRMSAWKGEWEHACQWKAHGLCSRGDSCSFSHGSHRGQRRYRYRPRRETERAPGL